MAEVVHYDRRRGAAQSTDIEIGPACGAYGNGRRAGGVAVEVLHNAIHPVMPLADLAAEVALDAMLRRLEPDGEITLRAGTPVVFNQEDRVMVDTDLVASEVQTSDERLLSGSWNCAAVYPGAQVIRDGVMTGMTLNEPNMVIEHCRVVSMSGQAEVRIGYRAVSG